MSELTKEQKSAIDFAQGHAQMQEIFDKMRSRKKSIVTVSDVKAWKKPGFLYELRMMKRGGVLAFYKNEDGTDMPYPRKGFAVKDAVENIDQVKKYLLGFAIGLKDMLLANKLKGIILILFFRKQLEILIEGSMISAHRQLKPYLLESKRYCDCAREVNRVLGLFGGFEWDFERNVKENIKPIAPITKHRRRVAAYLSQIIGSILEFDDSYRYRFQDVVGEFDRDKFNKNPISELIRLVEIGESREKVERVMKTWRLVKLFLRIVRFHPIKKDIILFFQKLNINEIKLSVEDIYWTNEKGDYYYQGKKLVA